MTTGACPNVADVTKKCFLLERRQNSVTWIKVMTLATRDLRFDFFLPLSSPPPPLKGQRSFSTI